MKLVLSCTTALLLALIAWPPLAGQELDVPGSSAGSDSLAVSAIFAEQHAVDSALSVHREAKRLSEQERYEKLVRWVLPGADHDTLRLQFDFAPLNPAPPVDLNKPAATAGSRFNSGGDLVSPALDLLAVARRLGKLEEIRRKITQWNPSDGRSESTTREAMLLLTELADDETKVTAERLDQLLSSASSDASAETPPSAAEMLLFHAAGQHPHLQNVVADAVHRYQPWVTAQYHRPPFQQHVAKMMAKGQVLQVQNQGQKSAEPSATPLQQWSPVSRTTAASRGLGYPATRWESAAGTVINRASHDDDYLYFAIPMRSRFDVECDVSAFGWQDSHLMVAGTWVAPVFTLSDFDIGHFRNRLPRVGFSPPLTKVQTWIHYRTTVRDSVATTFFNGRKIHEQTLAEEHDPWIAIRSTAQHDGAVRNLRITGAPIIPKRIRMSLDPQLHAWLPYYEEDRFNSLPSAWQHAGSFQEGGEIRSVPPDQQLTASQDAALRSEPGHVERLLRYHRPMLEDGTIAYEFFYIPGESLVHPAIDRLAFLLDPSGVRLHWITDGRYERTGLDPANVTDAPGGRLSDGTIPLKADAWNAINVRLSGDLLTLVLNGRAIYEHRLDSTNQRTFGLFHFADRTAVRARNIVWEGAWLQQLPSLEEQELLVDETGFLDERLSELEATFSHDFATEGLPVRRFAVVQGDKGVHVRAEADGLHTTRPGVEGYRHASVSPLLTVGGDFDITASFDDLQTDPQAPGSSSTIWLGAGSLERNEARLLRRQLLTQGDQQLVQCVRIRTIENELQRRYFSHQPIEALSGTLRLARRGDQIYYLFAESDSEQFRIVGTEDFTTADLDEQAISLTAQIQGVGGSTSVVWKNISVRAERLGGWAVGENLQVVAALNQQRDALPDHFTHDFTLQGPDPRLFGRWTDHREWNAKDGGLRVVHPGTDDWTSAGASLRKQLEGDFDVAIEFDLERLDDPAAGHQSTIYLQLELADTAQTQISAMITKRSGEAILALAQQRLLDGNGGYSYPQIGSLAVEAASGLRIARRGERVYFLVLSEELEGEALIAHTDVGTEPIGIGNTRLLVHTGGAGRESAILWKGIEVHAESLGADALPAARTAAPPAPKQEKSYLQSFFDLFR